MSDYQEYEEEKEKTGPIISQLKLYTKTRSVRHGRKNQVTEVYSNQGFSRSGGGTQDGNS